MWRPPVALAALLCGTGAAPAWQPPVSPACISSPFGFRHAVGPHAPAGFHNGIDLPAPSGALVHAVADGTIRIVKRQGLGGVSVQIAHAGGLVTLYAHLGNLVPAVAEGKRRMAAGDPIGHVARTGVTDASLFDLYGFNTSVLATAASHGFTNTTDPCYLQTPYSTVTSAARGATAQNIGGFIYWDTVHPTSQVHALWAGAFAADLATPAPEPASIAVLGAGLLGLVRLRRRFA